MSTRNPSSRLWSPAVIGAHRAARRDRTAPTPQPLPPVWLISATDHHDHAVTVHEMEVGLHAQRGVYRAVCDHLVLVCSLDTPPGPPCPACDEQLRPPPKPRWWITVLRSVLRLKPDDDLEQ
ncbi:MAG: hypothetical protein ACRDRH_15995 [Pseudonocardia sp.]